MVKDRFKEIKASIKIQEQTTEAILKKNFTYIDSQFKMIMDVPK
jgi:hypothetical protein